MTQAQIIRCKCKAIIAACTVPECYMDAEWQKDMRKYVKQGCSVELINCDKSWTVSKCKCKEIKAAQKEVTEPTLF